MKDWGAPAAWESIRLAPSPFYISSDCYLDCRNARPDVDWTGYETRNEIQVRRNDKGERMVMVIEATEAAKAIREALDVMIG